MFMCSGQEGCAQSIDLEKMWAGSGARRQKAGLNKMRLVVAATAG